jgi:multiple sugar transport system substrate-binding protein
MSAEFRRESEEPAMIKPTRRSVLRGSLGLAAAAGAFSAPYVANAQAKTATVWWVQGFAHEEDIAFQKLVSDYQKTSGNKIEATVTPYAPLRQKIVAGMTTGEVPDLFQNTPPEITALYAWDDKLVDVSDVVETQRQHYADTALALVNCYNSVAKKRSLYGVPYTIDVFTNHIWQSLVEKAGYKIEDIPKTWDAFYDFFKGVQKKLREQGMRNVYGMGFQLTTNGGDPNAFFDQWLIAYGGQNIVSQEGKLQLEDPQVKQAAVKALTYPTSAYKEGFVPPSAINWNDADDNNAFHSKTIVMDLDGSISTEVAIVSKKEDYDDIVTWGLADSNEGKPVPSWAFSVCGLIPKGAKNVALGKDFLRYLIQPEVLNEYLKTGLGRRVPAMPSIVKSDPWWMADPHRTAYTTQALLRPTLPVFWAYNPAYAYVQNEHVWQTAWAEIMKDGATPEAAAAKAFKRIEEIFAKYPITQN